MTKRYKNITIHPAQGGALIGSASDDVPTTQESNFLSSSANYTTKINFRRETDGELRREGWELFNPKETKAELGQWGNNIGFDPIDAKYPIRAIHQFPGANGTPTLIAIAGGKVWRLRSADASYAQDYGGGNNYSIGPDGKEYWLDADEDFYWQEIYCFDRHMDVVEPNGSLKSPFEGGAYRWEIVDVKNHVVINNGVDLPVVYKSEWDVAEPLYGLRENGVISVGTIASYQDRLFCGDLTVIVKGYDKWFTQASDPYGHIYESSLYGPQVNVQRYQYRMVYSSEGDPKLFNSGIVSGDAVVMESGGIPGIMTVHADGQYEFQPDYNFKIGTRGSMYKLYNDGLYQSDEAYTVNMISPTPNVYLADQKTLLTSSIFLDINYDSGGSYATASDDVNNEIVPYSTDFGPDNVYNTYDDDFKDYWETWTSYKLVNTEGDDIGLVQPGLGESGALLLDPGSYVVVLRPYVEQLRSPAAFREFPEDGSRILRMKSLADKLVVYRDSGFFFLSRTNSTDFPFAVEPRYTGGRVADFRHTIIDIDGKQHLFMGNSGIYAINRSSTEPQQISMFEIGPPFWQRVPPDLAEFVYAVDNPITREIFIMCPLGLLENEQGDYINEKGDIIYSEANFDYATTESREVYADDPYKSGDQEFWDLEPTYPPQPKLKWGVIAYDYVNKTLSEIDVSFTSCAYIRKPKHNRVGPEEAWFIMGVHQAEGDDYVYPGTQYRDDAQYGGVLCRYGYGPPKVNEREPYRIYSRLGEGYESKIKSGLIDFGDSYSDKECRAYVLELSSKYGTTPVRVRISTSTAPQGTEIIETMQTVDGQEIDYVELNNLVDENMIPMYVRAPYIRDEITVLPEYDNDGNVVNNPIKITGRTFEVSGVDTRSTTQTYNQG